MSVLWQAPIKREGATDGTGGGAGGNGDLLGTPQGGGSTPPGVQGAVGGANTGGTPPGNTGGNTGTGGGEASDWKHALPPELREDKSLGRYKTLADLASGYLNLQRHLSGEKLVVPGKNATDEDWRQVYEKLGLPKDAKEYGVKFKDGTTVDEKFAGEFTQLAHKAGILPKQAQALADWFSEKNKEAETEYTNTLKQQREAEVGALKKEWGDAFDKKRGLANTVFSQLPGDLQQALKEEGLTGNVKFTKALALIAEKYLSEDQIKGGTQSSLNQALSPAEAKKAADMIMGDFSHPYHQKEHPGHAAAVQEVAKLFAAMHAKG